MVSQYSQHGNEPFGEQLHSPDLGTSLEKKKKETSLQATRCGDDFFFFFFNHMLYKSEL